MEKENFNDTACAMQNRFFVALIAAKWAHQIQKGECHIKVDSQEDINCHKPSVLAIQALRYKENLPSETLEILSPNGGGPLDLTSSLLFSKEFL